MTKPSRKPTRRRANGLPGWKSCAVTPGRWPSRAGASARVSRPSSSKSPCCTTTTLRALHFFASLFCLGDGRCESRVAAVLAADATFRRLSEIVSGRCVSQHLSTRDRSLQMQLSNYFLEIVSERARSRSERQAQAPTRMVMSQSEESWRIAGATGGRSHKQLRITIVRRSNRQSTFHHAALGLVTRAHAAR